MPTVVQSRGIKTAANATSLAVSLASNSTLGNTIFLCISSDAIATVSGKTNDTPGGDVVNYTDLKVYRWAATGTTESVTISLNASTMTQAFIMELPGLASSPVDQSASNTTMSALTVSTGTTAATTQADEWCLAVFTWPWGATQDNVVSYSGGYTQLFQDHTTAGTNVNLAVATFETSATGTQSCTATVGTGGQGNNPCGAIITYKVAAAGSTQTVSPTGLASAEAFGTATVTPGAATISPSGLASGEALGATVVSAGPVTVSPSGIPTAEAFGTSVVTVGPVTITPTGIASAEAFGVATVTGGASQVITATGIASAEAFGTATVAPGPVTITAIGIVSAEAFGAARIGFLRDIDIRFGEADESQWAFGQADVDAWSFDPADNSGWSSGTSDAEQWSVGFVDA